SPRMSRQVLAPYSSAAVFVISRTDRPSELLAVYLVRRNKVGRGHLSSTAVRSLQLSPIRSPASPSLLASKTPRSPTRNRQATAHLVQPAQAATSLAFRAIPISPNQHEHLAPCRSARSR